MITEILAIQSEETDEKSVTPKKKHQTQLVYAFNSKQITRELTLLPQLEN